MQTKTKDSLRDWLSTVNDIKPVIEIYLGVGRETSEVTLGREALSVDAMFFKQATTNAKTWN